jgi:hypothetical protein
LRINFEDDMAKSGGGADFADGNIAHVDHYLRVYMTADEKDDAADQSDSDAKPPHFDRRPLHDTPAARDIEDLASPFGGLCLVLDCETFSFRDGQRLRFGFYQLRGLEDEEQQRLHRRGKLTREALDSLREEGIFYDPEALDDDALDELEELKLFAVKRNQKLQEKYGPDGPKLKLQEKDAFISKTFYRLVKTYGDDLLIIGHNLPFDLGALCNHVQGEDDKASNVEAGLATKFWYGGFWLKLCNCSVEGKCLNHPPVRVKKLGPNKHMFGWRTEGNKLLDTKSRVFSNFLDTATFAKALLSPPSVSLEYLTSEDCLNTTPKKVARDDHDDPIDQDYIGYCVNDVEATWAVWVALRDLYKQHDLKKPPWKIYSEASLGKAYLEAFEVPRFLPRHKSILPEIIGYHMAAYYGGRSEVRVRRKVCDVIHTDFKSQYPTVNALLKLQDLLLAERIEVRGGPSHVEEVQAFLDAVTLEDLQRPDTWPKLRSIVRVLPNDDIPPVRTTYDEEGPDTNIGVNRVLSGLPTWYTLADAVASKLLNADRAPKIDDAITLVGHGRVNTKEKSLFGNGTYKINLKEHDLFQRVIQLRTEIQYEAKRTGNPYYDRLQNALKILANATSYGILVEFRVDRRDEERSAHVYHSWGNQPVSTTRVETPGPYFAGPVGVHIPAGGRLLLAIAERLAKDRGFTYLFCDTDSMCFVDPKSIGKKAVRTEVDPDFKTRVTEIVDWFTPLSPYKDVLGDRAPILRIEDINMPQLKDEGDRLQPLCGLAISAKRYALYNRVPNSDGGRKKSHRVVIRKISAHGTGLIAQPEDYCTIYPDDEQNPRKLGKLVNNARAATLLRDLWRRAVEAVETGDEPRTHHPSLELAHMWDVALGTRGMWQRFEALPRRRPFMFFTMLPSPVGTEDSLSESQVEEADALLRTNFYGPRQRQLDAIKPDLKRSDKDAYPHLMDECLGLRYQTLNDALDGYFDRNEYKSFRSDDAGELQRNKLIILGHAAIGKETDQILDEENEQTDGEFNEALAPDPQFKLLYRLNTALFIDVDRNGLAAAIGVTRDALDSWATQRRGPHPTMRKKLAEAFNYAALNDGRFLDHNHPIERDKRRLEDLRRRIRVIPYDYLGEHGSDGMPAGPPWEPKREPEDDPLISLTTINPEEYPLWFDGYSRVAMAWTHMAAPKEGGYDHVALFKEKRQRVIDFLRHQKLEKSELRILADAVNAVEEEEQQRWDFIQDHFWQQRVRYRLAEKPIFEPVPRKGVRLLETQGCILADFDFTTEEILKLHELNPDIAMRMAWFQAIKNREAKDAPIVEGEYPVLGPTTDVKNPRQSDPCNR